MEPLERRLALAAAVSWDGANLTVSDNSGNTQGISVEIWADNTNNHWVEVSNVGSDTPYWDGSQHNCMAADVLSITVNGSDSGQNGDDIALDDVTNPPFVNLAGSAIKVYGNGGNDTITLGDLGEYANGGFGNDSILGGAGNDTIYGGDGFDYIAGYGGNDTLVAQSTVQNFSSPGNPIASSTVYGGSGNDTISDGNTFDYLDGGSGNDVITAGNGANRQYGDSINGGSGDDTITGTSFLDYITGGDGDDSVNGNGGDNTTTVVGGGGNNYLNPPSTNPPTPNDYGVPDGSHPAVGGLMADKQTVAEGSKLTLTATDVGIPIDPNQQNIKVTRVDFYIDANKNGKLDQDGQGGGDIIVGSVSGETLGPNVSYTIDPVDLGTNLQPGNYSFFAIATASNGFQGNYGKVSVTIQKDKVAVLGTSDATEEPPTDGLVTIEREGPNDFDLTVNFSTGDSDANNDYTASPGPASIIIPAGQSQAVVHITPSDDGIVESPDETVTLGIELGDYYDIDTPSYGVVTIHEDAEPTFTVSASPSSVAEGGGVTYTLTRSGGMSGSVTVNFGWSGSAIPGTDYTPPGYSSVVFADQQATATVTPTLLDDAGYGEPNEDLALVLEPDSHYIIGSPGYADVTIVEDDDSGGSSLMLNLPPRASGGAAPISVAQVRPFLQAAAHEWEAAGVDPAFINRQLAGATVHVADLPGSLLGETTDDEIWLDGDAAGLRFI